MGYILSKSTHLFSPTYIEALLWMHIFYSFIPPRQPPPYQFWGEMGDYFCVFPFLLVIYSLENCCHCHQKSSVFRVYLRVRYAQLKSWPSYFREWKYIQELVGAPKTYFTLQLSTFHSPSQTVTTCIRKLKCMLQTWPRSPYYGLA